MAWHSLTSRAHPRRELRHRVRRHAPRPGSGDPLAQDATKVVVAANDDGVRARPRHAGRTSPDHPPH